MKTVIRFFPAIVLIFCLCGCGKTGNLQELKNIDGIDCTGREIISSVDTHGGFHGDGYKLIEIQYADDSVLQGIAASENWHELPLPDNLQTFLYQPYIRELYIPEAENGYYYFYDRHSDSNNPYNDENLLRRPSFNFTVAIYDTDKNVLLFFTCDT